MMIQMSDAVRALQSPETLAALGYRSAPDRQPEAKPAAKMTKTEARYLAEVIRPQQAAGAIVDIAFQPVMFRLRNGHRYTPDFVCQAASGDVIMVEVKGSYRLQSYQRARLAFDQASLEWPCFVWIWAELQEDGNWKTCSKPKQTKEVAVWHDRSE